MELRVLPRHFTVCKVADTAGIDFSDPFVFVGKTDEEISLVCPAASVPDDCIAREDGWRAFRIEGELDFALVGIIAGISALLAEARIGIFVVSTFNTDYVLVRESNLDAAVRVLEEKGYVFV